MSTEVYRYTFTSSMQFEEIESSLVLAIMATESLHGQSEVRLDAAHAVDKDKRACVIDAGTPVGRDLNRIFIGFIGRERRRRFRGPQFGERHELLPHIGRDVQQEPIAAIGANRCGRLSPCCDVWRACADRLAIGATAVPLRQSASGC